MNAGKQKKISRRAGKIFASATPDHIIIRSQEDQEDYGIDFELEITDSEGNATGNIFKIQQKGVESVGTIDGGKYVSYGGLSVSRAKYYVFQIDTPTILSVVDVEAESIYWLEMQGNSSVQAAISHAETTGQKTLTVHIPAVNVYPDTIHNMLDKVESMKSYIATRRVSNFPIPTSSTILKEIADPDEAIRNLKDTAAIVQLSLIDRLVQSGKPNEAYERATATFSDQDLRLEARFLYGCKLYELANYISTGYDTDTKREEWLHRRAAVAQQLCQISFPVRGPLLRHALVLCYSSRVRLNSLRNQALLASINIQQHSGMATSATRLMTWSQRQIILDAIVSDFRRIQRQLVFLARSGDIVHAMESWADATLDLLMFIHTLVAEGQSASATHLVRWLDGFGDMLARTVVSANVTDHKYERAAKSMLVRITMASVVSAGDRDEIASSMARTIKSVPDKKGRKIVEDIASEGWQSLEASKALPAPSKHPNNEEVAQLIETLARRLGVDLSDEDDPLSMIVRIGIADSDPTRVLKTCKNMRIAIGSYGIPAQMLGLPMAGSTVLSCAIHENYSIEGIGIDGNYQLFDQEYCSKCSDRVPHDQGWSWSEEWQASNPGAQNDR